MPLKIFGKSAVFALIFVSQASADFLDQLNLTSEDSVLDVGCGLGGVARFAASRYGSHITGVDLTEEFVQTGGVMNHWLNLQDRIVL